MAIAEPLAAPSRSETVAGRLAETCREGVVDDVHHGVAGVERVEVSVPSGPGHHGVDEVTAQDPEPCDRRRLPSDLNLVTHLGEPGDRLAIPECDRVGQHHGGGVTLLEEQPDGAAGTDVGRVDLLDLQIEGRVGLGLVRDRLEPDCRPVDEDAALPVGGAARELGGEHRGIGAHRGPQESLAELVAERRRGDAGKRRDAERVDLLRVHPHSASSGCVVSLHVGVGPRIAPVPSRAVEVDTRDRLGPVAPLEQGVTRTARVELVDRRRRALGDVEDAEELAVAARDVGERLVEGERRARDPVGELPRVGDVGEHRGGEVPGPHRVRCSARGDTHRADEERSTVARTRPRRGW